MLTMFIGLSLHSQNQHEPDPGKSVNTDSTTESDAQKYPAFLEEYAVDAELSDARINFFSVNTVYGSTGFFGSIPCYMLCDQMLPVSFSGIIKNQGSDEINTGLSVRVIRDFTDEIYEGTSSSITLESGMSDTLHTGDPYFGFNPENPVSYSVFTFEISASTVGGTDGNPENDKRVYQTALDQSVYARDNQHITGQWSTCSYEGQSNNGDQIGVIYPFFKSSKIQSAEIFIGAETDPGTDFIAHLYTRSGLENEFVLLTSSALINIGDASETATMLTVYFQDEALIPVLPGDITEVMVSVEYFLNNPGNGFFIGVDSTAPTSGNETMMFFSSGNVWTTLNENFVPFMRLVTESYNCDIPFDLGDDISYCGSSVTLDAGDGFYAYEWNGVSGGRYLEVTADASYEVLVTDFYGCTASDLIEVSLYEIPVPEMSMTQVSGNGVADGTASVSVTSGTADFGYSWSNMETGTTIVNLPAGEYCVTVTDANGCTASGCIVVSVTNVNPLVAVYSLRAFPIPAGDLIAVDHGSDCSDIRLVDARGRIYFESKTIDNSTLIDVSDLSPGLYLIQCTTLRGTISLQVIIE